MPLYRATPTDGIAWITGASSGIGRALALDLARDGWTVAATARKADDLAALAAEAPAGKILPMPGDVTDTTAMADIVARLEAGHGPIALAILNAGVYLSVTADDLEVEPFRKSFDVNLSGTVNALVPVLQRMRARRRGQLVIVSSVTGYGGLPTSAAYGATKAGLTNLAESLKFDLDKLGVRIQVVHPGFVETPATADNPFPMPFIVTVATASQRIRAGIAGGGFEITFPRRFTYGLKVVNLLPYPLYFWAVNRFTGWSKR
ncbi:SDR family NAD(P)-dependent oxidoreductase [Methylobrevis albus]|uniref:SDR family NAD(P)-dependent oxidoreductase n=1 Tax=Methylobrevis albus TaxID=2793297 RepID=A0A931I6L8_9HYPH|nr:SDR family NAD(P)-dependent oxidoreductase [Methylobrevis albus]MBH0239758.1 SDR family NAD(P)-dependent oxidoreductase [Methylobrevis albus]